MLVLIYFGIMVPLPVNLVIINVQLVIMELHVNLVKLIEHYQHVIVKQDIMK